MQHILAAAAAAALSPLLTGCGGGSGTTTTPTSTGSPSTVTTTTTTTTTATPTTSPYTTTQFTTQKPPNPPAPRPGAEVAALMNQEFHGFDAANPHSSYGVFLRASQSTKVHCHMTCYNGFADCRVSGSIFSNQIMVYQENGTVAWSGVPEMATATGFFVNQTEIKRSLGKCAYVYDGGTDARYNMGCGCRAKGKNDCNDHASAFWNLDQDSGYTLPLNTSSKYVEGCAFDSLRDAGRSFYKGPAYDDSKPDEMFQMMQWRAKNQHSESWQWNEMVLDGEEMVDRLGVDPASVMPAIVYVPALDAGARQQAVKMARDFQKQWNLPTAVPVIKLDVEVNARDGGNPFVFENVSEEGAMQV